MWLTLEIDNEKVMFGTVYQKGSSKAQNNTLLREIINNARHALPFK